VTRTRLVLFPGALGDFICFLPTLHGLRGQCADEELAVIVQASLLPLAIRPGLADRGVALESAWVARLFTPGAGLALPMPGVSVGDVYSWFGSGDSVVRENLGKLAEGRVHCAPFGRKSGHEEHVARHFLKSARLPVGLAATGAYIPLTAEENERAEGFWCRKDLAGRGVLVVHRGAGSRLKRWTPRGYEAVTRWWRARGGAVLEVAGPAEPDEPFTPGHVLVRGMALGDVAALLARADLFVGNDTGVSHLAGAVGTRGVVIFGSTQARSWRPIGGHLVVMKPNQVPSGDGEISLGAVSSARVIRALEILALANAQP
jgi:ADP-heptose:LPS heptosyltransferase